MAIVALVLSIIALIVSTIYVENVKARKDAKYMNALLKIRNRNKFIEQQQNELDKHKKCVLAIESLVNGKREPKDIVDRIKKELSSVQR